MPHQESPASAAPWEESASNTSAAHGNNMSPNAVITAGMLVGLPQPVRRFLEFPRVLRKSLPSRVVVQQTGRIRQAPQKPWMKFRATESYSIDPPGFVWNATAGYGHLPLFKVQDSYVEGKGLMRVKLAGLYPVVNAHGPAMDESSAVRFFNEMMWFPFAYVRPNVAWKAIDDTSAEALFLHNPSFRPLVIGYSWIPSKRDGCQKLGQPTRIAPQTIQVEMLPMSIRSLSPAVKTHEQMQWARLTANSGALDAKSAGVMVFAKLRVSLVP
jgi:uncharacterized protein DUF6544